MPVLLFRISTDIAASVAASDKEKLILLIVGAAVVCGIIATVVQCCNNKDNISTDSRRYTSVSVDIESAAANIADNQQMQLRHATDSPDHDIVPSSNTSISSIAVDSYQNGSFATPPRASSAKRRRSSARIEVEKAAARAATMAAIADGYMQEVDYFIRHKEDFHAVAFYYSVKLLEQQLPPPEKLKVKDIRDFLRKRPDVKLLKNGTAFKLVHLTPFREPNVQVFGKFQCVNVVCRNGWESLCSYADHYQICHTCGQRVYPFVQRPLAQNEYIAYQQHPTDENFIDYDEVAYIGRRDSFINVVTPAKTAKLSSSSSIIGSSDIQSHHEYSVEAINIGSSSADSIFDFDDSKKKALNIEKDLKAVADGH